MSCPEPLLPINLPGNSLCIKHSCSDSTLSKSSLPLPFMKVCRPLRQALAGKRSKDDSNDIKIIGQSLVIEQEGSPELGLSMLKKEPAPTYDSSSDYDAKLTTVMERLNRKHSCRDVFWVEFAAEKPEKKVADVVSPASQVPSSSLAATRKSRKKVWHQCTHHIKKPLSLRKQFYVQMLRKVETNC